MFFSLFQFSHRADPPIKSQADCASAVTKLIKQGVCHPNGRFFGTFCHTDGKPSCYCQLANGATPKWYTSTVGNDILELIPDDPCLRNNGGCLESATCENNKGKAVCKCKEGLVGDGRHMCETESQCLSSQGKTYELVMENKYLSGDRCGHYVPGDWKYGECSEKNSKFTICNSYSTSTNNCAKHDPPILSQDDCAKTVRKLIKDGTCHPNGQFFGTFCNANGKMSCYCQLNGGATPKLYSSTVGNDVMKLIPLSEIDTVLCPGQPEDNYCDGYGDCDNHPDWCSCPKAQLLCSDDRANEDMDSDENFDDFGGDYGADEDECTNGHDDRPGATSEDRCKAMEGCCYTHGNDHCEKCQGGIEVGATGEEANYYTFMVPLTICAAAFGFGYFVSAKKNAYNYKPLLDGKPSVEMQ